jgi:hypothetical protein
MAFSLAAGMQTATWLSAGMGKTYFLLLDWPALEPQSMRPHMQKRRRSLRTVVAAHARALCDHGAPLADRRKSPVWRSTEATYISTG